MIISHSMFLHRQLFSLCAHVNAVMLIVFLTQIGILLSHFHNTNDLLIEPFWFDFIGPELARISFFFFFFYIFLHIPFILQVQNASFAEALASEMTQIMLTTAIILSVGENCWNKSSLLWDNQQFLSVITITIQTEQHPPEERKEEDGVSSAPSWILTLFFFR